MEIGSYASQVVGVDLETKMIALRSLGFDFIEPTRKQVPATTAVNRVAG